MKGGQCLNYLGWRGRGLVERTAFNHAMWRSRWGTQLVMDGCSARAAAVYFNVHVHFYVFAGPLASSRHVDVTELVVWQNGRLSDEDTPLDGWHGWRWNPSAPWPLGVGVGRGSGATNAGTHGSGGIWVWLCTMTVRMRSHSSISMLPLARPSALLPPGWMSARRVGGSSSCCC